MKLKFAFFGSSDYSVIVLDILKSAGYLPAVVITGADKPKGRGLKLTPSPVKIWAEKNGIPVLTPAKLDSSFLSSLLSPPYSLNPIPYTLFLVVAYGKIIPKNILEIPKFGALNLHTSLLPKYRGASPIESAILNNEKENGATVMQMDEMMDHGPIISQVKIQIKNWPPKARELGRALVEAGGKELARILPDWVAGKIKPAPQDESRATYCKKISKEDGLIDLSADPFQNFLKIQAYDGWPGAYFFAEKGKKKIRVIIKEAEYADDALAIKKVLPEGKKEIGYREFLRNLGNLGKS